jgi:hypothetical protein
MPGINRILLSTAATLTGALALAGCGSSSTPASPSSTPTSTASASGAPSGPPSGLPSGAAAAFAKIGECLKAAGIKVPSGLPTGVPSGLPTGLPTGLPSGAPTGSFSPPAGGPGNLLTDPKVQAALKACGIALPGPGGTS